MTTEADAPRDVTRLQNAAAAGGVLGAIAASSCCMLPLLLFTLGASGPWIGTLVGSRLISRTSLPSLLRASGVGTGSCIGRRS